MVIDDAWKLENDFGKRVRLLRTLSGLPQRKMSRLRCQAGLSGRRSSQGPWGSPLPG